LMKISGWVIWRFKPQQTWHVHINELLQILIEKALNNPMALTTPHQLIIF
jgi:hypothetical protein